MTIIAHVEPMDLDIYSRDNYYFNYKSDAYKKIMSELSARPSRPSVANC